MEFTKRKKILIITILLVIISILLIPNTLLNWNIHTNLGSNSIGSATKEIYDHYHSNKTIVVITGIHPRETLAIEPEQEALKQFAVYNNAKIINYNVKVTQDKDDYNKSRTNGESLIAEYIVPDMNNTKPDVVIISHSHVSSYGKGFYIATPAMDEPSVKIAENIKNSGINFGYYPVSDSMHYKSTSAVLVSKPIAESGYPTLVYEIPENITKEESTNKTYDLLRECLKTI